MFLRQLPLIAICCKKKEGPNIWWTQSNFIVIVVPQQRKKTPKPICQLGTFQKVYIPVGYYIDYIPLRGKLEGLSHIYISHEINFPVLSPHRLWDKLSSLIDIYIYGIYIGYLYIYIIYPHLYPMSLHFMKRPALNHRGACFRSQVLLMGRAGVWSSGHLRSPGPTQNHLKHQIILIIWVWINTY